MTEQRQIFRGTSEDSKLEIKNNYAYKNLKNALKTYLVSLSIADLKKLESEIEKKAKTLNVIQRRIERYQDKAALLYSTFLANLKKIRDTEFGLFKKKYSSLISDEKKLEKISSDIVQSTREQIKVIDTLLPKRVKNELHYYLADDKRFLPQFSHKDQHDPEDKDAHLNNLYYGHLEQFHRIQVTNSGMDSYWAEFRNLLDSLPHIRREVLKKEKSAKTKKKKQERSATLAAYEDKSRNIGRSIMAKMKSEVSSPFYCPYCSKKMPKTKIHVDHINPVSNGGLSVERNLVPVCSDCNLSKSDLSLRAFCKKNSYDFDQVCNTLEDMGKFI